jgi:hypothetical protein
MGSTADKSTMKGSLLASVWDDIVKQDLFIKKLFKLAPSSGKNAGVLNTDVLDKKLDKKGVCDLLIEALALIQGSSSIMRQATIELDNYKEQVIKAKCDIVEVQKKLVTSQEQRFENLEHAVTCKVQDTLQSEMKSYSAVVSKSTNNVNSTPRATIRSVVEDTLREDERKRNIILFGMKECDPEDLKDNVLEILEDIDQKPVLVDVMRFGQPGSKPRPVKVVCESSATVRSILKGSPGLKSSKDFSSVFIVPDRSPEQRLERQRFILKLKDEIEDRYCSELDPKGTRYYIRNGKIIVQLPEPTPKIAKSITSVSSTLRSAPARRMST